MNKYLKRTGKKRRKKGKYSWTPTSVG